jgi:ABC-type cobalamin/Fe3+-siderophores transport system ATPase subunit
MARPLILESLGVRGFRAFNNLLVERLGRVNLVVGKNNVGKTALLEALWLYVFQGSSEIIWQILEVHDERKRPHISAAGISEERQHALTETTRRNYKLARYQVPALRYLFHGRRDIRERIEPLVIGPINSPEKTLSVSMGYWVSQGKVRFPVKFEDRDDVEEAFLALSVRVGAQKESVYRLDNSNSLLQGRPPLSNCVLVDAYGLNDENLWEYWDAIALTDLEYDVVRALRIIAPEVERVNMIGSQQSGEPIERIPVVKVVDIDDPLPLRSLGEGMNRLFGIALALVNAKDGILLVDEIESGLHYSAQLDVWRLIFETAHRLNVQVFATTHSSDCIKAFQQAADENKEEDGILIRLENRKGKIVATEFDERRLGIATREEIEVR